MFSYSGLEGHTTCQGNPSCTGTSIIPVVLESSAILLFLAIVFYTPILWLSFFYLYPIDYTVSIQDKVSSFQVYVKSSVGWGVGALQVKSALSVHDGYG